MKCLKFLLFILFIITACSSIYAQTNEDAHALVKEGVQLNGAKKYAEAIDKYNQALKIDSGYLFADYQLALSLFASDKGTDGIPYLQKVIKGNTSLSAAAFELLGLIYFRNKQFAEAEQSSIAAIKLDPKHANSQRIYALVTFHQNKRMCALMGFCSFILLEPNTPRSAEAFGNIQHILQGGALKPEPGEKTPPATDVDNAALNQVITQAIAETAKKKYATPADLLTEQLKAIFTTAGALTEKKANNDFFRRFYAAFFYKLAQSPNMPAFARLISGSSAESAKWIKDNPQLMADLDNWVKGMERSF
jgi:tetratricopeptide (TPR) repeat protein